MDCFGQKPCNSIFATGLCHIRYPRVSVFKLMPYLDSETLRSQSCLKQRWLPLERQGRFHVLSSHKQNIRQHPQWKHALQTKQSMVTQKSNCCETMHVCEQKLFFISLGKVLFSYAARPFRFSTWVLLVHKHPSNWQPEVGSLPGFGQPSCQTSVPYL